MKSINLTKRMLAVSLVTVVSLCIAAIAQAQISSPSADVSQDTTITPSNSSDSNQDGQADVTSSPSNELNQDGQAGVTSSPSKDSNQDGQAGVTSSPSSDSNQDGPATNQTPSTPTTPTNSSGGSSSSSGSSGSYVGYSSGGSSVSTIATAAPVNGFCPFVSALMRPSGANDPVEVAKLQAFLKDTEGYGVTVNGAFDQQTEAAVVAFQTKYMSDIMGPWGATKASGTVYLTTVKKINQIACSTALNLSAADLSIINAYKQAEASGTNAGPVGVNQGANNGVAVGPTIPASASSSNGTAGNQNVAAIGQASILQRFWSFLKSLF